MARRLHVSLGIYQVVVANAPCQQMTLLDVSGPVCKIASETHLSTSTETLSLVWTVCRGTDVSWILTSVRERRPPIHRCLHSPTTRMDSEQTLTLISPGSTDCESAGVCWSLSSDQRTL